MNITETTLVYSIFEGANDYYGLGEVTLPDITNVTQEVSGAGIAGKFESVLIGQIEAMSLSINFKNISADVIKLYEQRTHILEFRVAQQYKDSVSGEEKIQNIKHVASVFPKKISLGKIASSSPGDGSGEYSVSKFETYIGGKKIIEIDPFNMIYKINSTDYLEDVRKALGK